MPKFPCEIYPENKIAACPIFLTIEQNRYLHSIANGPLHYNGSAGALLYVFLTIVMFLKHGKQFVHGLRKRNLYDGDRFAQQTILNKIYFKSLL
ncbi:MAG: hypothetical protein A2942_03970 [Candidatus Lloydbacteria bacterium RIFCSPLOWO2_01_FULL_50_20]|uniref:Uncharacterized protein n=1 Tax=Candidatus Lloydbacteria bacterium RIFCSPLOWO2_01_FULL_50_20 TaxID=1798665 RepID=A0A1G2DJ54_9BACT|nr:MAG: hypothetical protein A2942_03970 [Candidatus Lloydbacteria bacterium RIFCSPLOWO2_01_FULL_50_20]